jgi:hypothetical protein
MLELTLNHEIDCSAERFWELFFDAALTREMIVGGLGFASCDCTEAVSRNGKRERSMRVTPKIDVPEVVAKLLGPKLGYTERGSLDEKSMVWTYTLELSVLADRIRMGGSMTVEAAGPGKCRRLSKPRVEARILAIGGLVEKAAEKNLRDGWSKSAVWLNGWLAKHPG